MTADQIKVALCRALAEVAAAVPKDIHPTIVIIVSLATAYWFSGDDEAFSVYTKVIDSVDGPRLRLVWEHVVSASWKILSRTN